MDQAPARHLPYLDGWRGLAICGLLAGHFAPSQGMNLGALGVNLFFVLSGLLMGRLLFLDEVPLATFYRRRIARIFPLAYAFLAAITLGWVALGLPLSVKEMLAAGVFVSNYVRNDIAIMPLGHFWSLCVEEHAYVVLSLVALGVRARWFGARTAIGVALLAMVGIGLTYARTYHGPDLYHELWLHSEVSAFGIFMSAYLLLQCRDRMPRTVPWPVFGALSMVGVAMHWWRFGPPMLTFVGVGALALAVNLLERTPAWVRDLISFKPLRQLGIWSFSIYIWQQPFYQAVEAQRMPALFGTACALLAGIASFYLIEQPARSWLNKRWRSRPPNTVEVGLAIDAHVLEYADSSEILH